MESDPNRSQREGKGIQRPYEPLAGCLDEGFLQRQKAVEEGLLERSGRQIQQQSPSGANTVSAKPRSAVISRLYVYSNVLVRNCASDKASRVAEVETELCGCVTRSSFGLAILSFDKAPGCARLPRHFAEHRAHERMSRRERRAVDSELKSVRPPPFVLIERPQPRRQIGLCGAQQQPSHPHRISKGSTIIALGAWPGASGRALRVSPKIPNWRSSEQGECKKARELRSVSVWVW
jgi:hypothetical protein